MSDTMSDTPVENKASMRRVHCKTAAKQKIARRVPSCRHQKRTTVTAESLRAVSAFYVAATCFFAHLPAVGAGQKTAQF